ncbi:MAG: 5'/3'-nucleotidase SurE [Acidobacteriia bacterium]|nr:5'/3'-nucleotidase SurE [Terriglobia bacterium]
MRILVTNDDGWDAPGLAALKTLAGQLGEVFVLAPKDPHSYAGHRVTTDCPLILAETGAQEFTLTGTPADCVRVAVSTLFPDVDWVLSGINRGGNLGADIFTSGTVAAVREAALLGRPGIAVSQYIRKGVALDWGRSVELALPVVAQLIAEGCPAKGYWNMNLPHLDVSENDARESAAVIRCDPDNEPLDVRFRQEGDRFHYAGSYPARRRTAGRDVEHCFGGSITVSCLQLR